MPFLSTDRDSSGALNADGEWLHIRCSWCSFKAAQSRGLDQDASNRVLLRYFLFATKWMPFSEGSATRKQSQKAPASRKCFAERKFLCAVILARIIFIYRTHMSIGHQLIVWGGPGLKNYRKKPAQCFQAVRNSHIRSEIQPSP